MKKRLIATTILMSFLSIGIHAEETSIDKMVAESGKIHLINSYEKEPEIYKNAERLEEDLELETLLIERFKEKFVNLKDTFKDGEYDKLMNSYFIDALKTNNSRLADFILNDSGAEIDVNYDQNENPKITPLQAAATSIGMDGGNIEYFMKLVDMGADYKAISNKKNIPLMSLAATVDNYKIVYYLALMGENIMHIDDYDYYPLDYAIRNSSSKSTLILVGLMDEFRKRYEKKEKEIRESKKNK